MDQVRVYYDRMAKTLTVWFSDPSEEYVCEETGDEVVLMKGKDGRVIGIEKLHFAGPERDKLNVAFETVG